MNEVKKEILRVRIESALDDGFNKHIPLTSEYLAEKLLDMPFENEKMSRYNEFNYILKFAEQKDLSWKVCFNQFRSLWTTYCLHYDLAPDTTDYDSGIAMVWKAIQTNATNPWNYAEEDDVERFNLFDLAMGEYLC